MIDCVMTRKGKNRGDKRRKSSDEVCEQISKNPRNGGSPVNTDVLDKPVSDSLRSARSALYDMDMDQVFSTPPASPSKLIRFTNSVNPISACSAQVPDNNTNDVLSLLQKMDCKLNSMDKKLQKLDSLEDKVSSLDSEIKKMWSFIHEGVKKSEDRINILCDKTDNLDFSLGEACDKIKLLETTNKQLKDDLTYIQSQSMRNNLVFGNIFEKESERPEQTEIELRKFMMEKLKIAQDLVNKIQFERVHRMGQKEENGKHRNIVAKFTLFKDKEIVRKQGKQLTGTNYYMFEQFPREIAQKLVPKMKAAISSGKQAWISYDKLYINGRPVKNSVERS